MPDIQGSDVARKLMLRYGLVGASPSPFLSPELVPVVVVDDLTTFDVLDPTFERPYQASALQAGAVALRALVVLSNPVGSGVLCTLRQVVGCCNLASTINMQSAAAGATDVRGFSTDTRLTARGACGLRGVQRAALGPQNNFFWRLGACTDGPRFEDFLPFQFVISPGQAIEFTQELLNDTMRLSIRWTERLLLPGEL